MPSSLLLYTCQALSEVRRSRRHPDPCPSHLSMRDLWSCLVPRSRFQLRLRGRRDVIKGPKGAGAAQRRTGCCHGRGLLLRWCKPLSLCCRALQAAPEDLAEEQARPRGLRGGHGSRWSRRDRRRRRRRRRRRSGRRRHRDHTDRRAMGRARRAVLAEAYGVRAYRLSCHADPSFFCLHSGATKIRANDGGA